MSEVPVKLYIASKSEHGTKWQAMRHVLAGVGVEIVSTWIDESGPGESADMTDLWVRCIAEAASCDLLVAVHHGGEIWKGAFVEIGAALAHARPVYVVGNPPGSWSEHPLVRFAGSIEDAIEDFWKLPAPSVHPRELEVERDLSDRLAAELAKWGWGDMHYGVEQAQEPQVAALVQEHAARRAVAR